MRHVYLMLCSGLNQEMRKSRTSNCRTGNRILKIGVRDWRRKMNQCWKQSRLKTYERKTLPLAETVISSGTIPISTAATVQTVVLHYQ